MLGHIEPQARRLALDAAVVKRGCRETHDVRRRHDAEAEMRVHDVRARFTQEAFVQEQAAAAERTRTERLLQPLAPLRIVDAIRFLVLRLEHSDAVLSNTDIPLNKFVGCKNSRIVPYLCQVQSSSLRSPVQCVQDRCRAQWLLLLSGLNTQNLDHPGKSLDWVLHGAVCACADAPDGGEIVHYLEWFLGDVHSVYFVYYLTNVYFGQHSRVANLELQMILAGKKNLQESHCLLYWKARWINCQYFHNQQVKGGTLRSCLKKLIENIHLNIEKIIKIKNELRL